MYGSRAQKGFYLKKKKKTCLTAKPCQEFQARALTGKQAPSSNYVASERKGAGLSGRIFSHITYDNIGMYIYVSYVDHV